MSFVPRANNKLTRTPVLSLSTPRDKRVLKVVDREELIASWQQSALGALDEIELRRREGSLTPRDWKDLSIAAGVSTEKTFLSAGQPTEIIGNLHAHRHEIGPLMARIARAIGPQREPVARIDSQAAKIACDNARIVTDDARIVTTTPALSPNDAALTVIDAARNP